MYTKGIDNTEDLLRTGSAALKKAAMNIKAKQFLLENKQLFNLIRKAADRYIGGESLEDVIGKVRKQNQSGMKCSIEYMGENAASVPEAIAAIEEFIRICNNIRHQQLNSTVSLDLSHIGLGISRDLCLENLDKICEAAQGEIEIIISAEDSDKTDQVLNTYTTAAKKHPDLAITLQAYLHRTKDDLQHLLQHKGRIRIVKGAFDTPPHISIPRGHELNEIYLGYIDNLLASGHKCSIATHDRFIQTEAKKLIDLHKPAPGLYEFESLYGIQTEQLLGLKADGYMTKLYFVYGKEWYLYICNRIAENPMNLFLAVADMVA